MNLTILILFVNGIMLRSLVLRRAFHSTRCRPNFISELREVKDDFIRRKKGTKHANRKIRPVEDEEADKFEKLLEIINKSKKSTFSDPANRKMDLSGSNSHIYNTLMSDVRRRKQNRVKFADENWKKNYHKLQDEIFPNISDRKTKNSLIAEGISYSLKEAVISVESAGSSINVGDVVALSDDSTSFYIVVGIPKKITSPYYTYINKQGEIVFGTKDRIRLRFPQAIPQTYKILLESLVSLEVKWKNMAPVGYPDAEFSKSEPSLSTASKPSSLDDDLSMRDDDDLIISSASSQLLTNSDVLTYQVTQTARELYSDALRDLGISTSNEIPSITKKLEYLHKFLQIDESGEVINSPRTISIFELMEYLTRLSLNENGSSVLVNQKEIDLNDENSLKSVLDSLRLGSKKYTLGKAIPTEGLPPLGEYKISTFLALILSIRHQSRLWNLNQQNPSNPPISVTILPIAIVSKLNELILELKSNENIAVSFAEYVLSYFKRSEIKNKPTYYSEIVNLFKDYVAGNLTSDPEAEVAIVSIIRKVEELANNEKIVINSGPEPSFEYSKLRCFEILHILQDPFQVGKNGWENPITWSYALQLPDMGVLKSADNQKRYFGYLDETLLGNEEQISELNISDLYNSDPLELIREDFTSTPVYCIDSESAHEIDDGISIEEKNGKYVVSVHVANPTSYIKPTSNLSEIAFNKSTTTYLPEGPTMMLPKFMANLAGLGIDGVNTRTFVIQYQLPMKLISDYNAAKENDLEFFNETILRDLRDNMLQTSEIKVGIASNFPKGFSYSRVNEVLNDKVNVEKFKSGELENVDFNNLFKLHNISKVLKDIRVFVGDAISFQGRNSSINVQYETKGPVEPFSTNDGVYKIVLEDGKGPLISIDQNDTQGSDSKSQLLVSECMISANTVASKYAKSNNISIIFRSQDMKLDSLIKSEIREISRIRHLQNQDLDIESTAKILPFLTSARLQTTAKSHESLGVEGYATVTSPLRRFADMINHWKFEDHLMKSNLGNFDAKCRIADNALAHIACHLQSCELVNKQSQRFSHNFWICVFLKQYSRYLENNRLDPIKFRLLIQSIPTNGSLKVQMLEFGDIRAHLSVTPLLLEQFSGDDLKVGSTIEGFFKFEKLDYIEHEVVLEVLNR